MVNASSVLDLGKSFYSLKYIIDDKMATKPSLHIFGIVDNKIGADGFEVGAIIDWTAPVERFAGKPDVFDFLLNRQYFSSQID